MMRRSLPFGLILSLCLGLLGSYASPPPGDLPSQDRLVQEAAQAPAKADQPNPWPIIRTYTLKHVGPDSIIGVAKLYLVDYSAFGRTITVKLYEQNLPKFEELLKKLDVEKKTVQFQVFAIVASREREEDRKRDAIADQAAALAQAATLKPAPGTKAAPKEAPAYSGEPITLKFKDTDIRDVVLSIAEFARLNVVFDAEVRGTVTCNFADIPWDEALDIILRQNTMGKSLEGKMLRVAPLRIISRERNPGKGDEIENKELRKVLDELKSLWNFKTYEVDGPSFLTVQEDSGPDNFKLVTNRALNLVVSNIKVRGDEPGKRTVAIEQLKLSGTVNFADYIFVDTHDVTLKEKGYLVAGVSGYGSSSNALILVINAEIK